ncbi:MAG TPA: O-antigen ligase domain-containing protein [Myxococcales bacterium]|nr:O-antigen ligase domain-containing protein [Myxococcales bacterium]
MRPNSTTNRTLVLIVIGMAAAALLLGGIHKESIIFVALVALGAVWTAIQKHERVNLDAFSVLIASLVAITFLQLIPLPIGWVESLAPKTASTYLSAAAALGESPPQFVSLSLDFDATLLAAVWMIALWGGYHAARLLAIRQRRAIIALTAIPLIGAIIVAIGLVHAVLGLDNIYGFYERASVDLPFKSGAFYISSFVNANHLAAFLNLGLPIALVHAVSEQQEPQKRILYLGIFLILSAGIVLTMSRAGILTGCISTSLVLLGRGIQLLSWRVGAPLLLIATLMLVTGLAGDLAKLATSSGLYNSLEREMQTIAFLVTENWPWTGVGRGAFAVAHTQINDGISAYTITHAHNTPLQYLADYGLIFGGAAVLSMVVIFGSTLKRSLQNPLYWSAVVALLAVGLHNLVDFSLDLLGVAFPAVVMMGIIRSQNTGFELRTQRLKWAISVLAIAVVAAAIWTGPEVGPRRDNLIQENPQEAVKHYRADAYAFLQAGVANTSLPMLEHAQKLHLNEANIHLAVAALSPREKAWPIIRKALSLPYPYRVKNKAFLLIEQRAITAEDALDSLPENDALIISYLKWRKTPSLGLLKYAIRRYGDRPKLLQASADILLTMGQFRLVDDLATQLMIMGDKAGYRINGKLLLHQGQPEAAFHMFTEAGDPTSLMDAAETAIQMRNKDKALHVLKELKTSPKSLPRIRDLRRRALALE